jgi:hypothetical protein
VLSELDLVDPLAYAARAPRGHAPADSRKLAETQFGLSEKMLRTCKRGPGRQGDHLGGGEVTRAQIVVMGTASGRKWAQGTQLLGNTAEERAPAPAHGRAGTEARSRERDHSRQGDASRGGLYAA